MTALYARAVITLAASLLLAQLGGVAWAKEGRPSSFMLGLGVGGETRDALSISDSRPNSHGLALADVQVLALLGKHWQPGVEFQIGSSWFDFRQDFFVSGNIKDQLWVVRARLDRRFWLGDATSLYFGGGLEYGEGLSWSDTPSGGEKLRTFVRGGSVRIGAGRLLCKRLELFGEIQSSTFKAHAQKTGNPGDFNWLGRSSLIQIGTRIAIVQRGDS